MLELIKNIFKKWGCSHKWNTYAKRDVYNKPNDTMPYESRHTLICSECGKIKKIIL